ncbi:hypothetical protein L2E82_17500 [Cichorium intybus]|uniref:Uncharacterized protein n=1 Tax=Cichorium intybus TaxID=13427 RepID=A0ACB9F992_CICIN|nr:hypothetical protein L2E82_17500 [Cichorium intybus]
MSSEVEVVDGVQESKDRDAANCNVNGMIEGGVDGESLRDDVYTADVYGYLEKLPRLVESEASKSYRTIIKESEESEERKGSYQA